MKIFFSILALVFGIVLFQTFTSEGPFESSNIAFEESRQVDDFYKIAISGALDVEIKIGSETKIMITSESGRGDLIQTKVENGLLRINPKNNAKIKRKDEIRIYITVPDIELLRASGASNIKLIGNSLGDLRMDISGASDILSNITFQNLNLEASGASDIKLEGKAKSVVFKISGASDVKATTFEIEDLKARVSGASDVKVQVKGSLDVQASGASSFIYDGNPTINKSNASGAASINRM